MGSIPMIKEPVYFSRVDHAILKALKDSQEPMRYNKLHKEASNVFGRRIWIKTFNDHLKKLGENGEVIRNEKSRYNVTYEPTRRHSDDVLRSLALEKSLLDGIFNVIAKTKDPKERASRTRVLVRRLSEKKRWLSLQGFIDAICAFEEGKEREAQKIIEESAFAFRTSLEILVRALSKVDGIVEMLKEIKEEREKELDELWQDYKSSYEEQHAQT